MVVREGGGGLAFAYSTLGMQMATMGGLQGGREEGANGEREGLFIDGGGAMSRWLRVWGIGLIISFGAQLRAAAAA